MFIDNVGYLPLRLLRTPKSPWSNNGRQQAVHIQSLLQWVSRTYGPASENPLLEAWTRLSTDDARESGNPAQPTGSSDASRAVKIVCQITIGFANTEGLFVSMASGKLLLSSVLLVLDSHEAT